MAAKWAVRELNLLTLSLSGRITRVLNWPAETTLPFHLRLCGWTLPTAAVRGWQLAPQMAPILGIRPTLTTGARAMDRLLSVHAP